MFDVCVIGHITKDIVSRKGHSIKEMPGGVAYYSAMALRSLGLQTAVITKVAKADSVALLKDLKSSGVVVFDSESRMSTVFENIYSDDCLDIRDQKVRSIASEFQTRDLINVRAAVFHVGPLTYSDISTAFLKDVAARGGKVSLDVQGLLRRIESGQVTLTDWLHKRAGLARVDIMKADEREAQILSGEHDCERAARILSSFGPSEVIVTLGSRGSLIVSNGRTYKIPAFPARRVVDTTGCGDTYVAGYIAHRLISDDIRRAGLFAAALATLKLERFGPFQGSREEVDSLVQNSLRPDRTV